MATNCGNIGNPIYKLVLEFCNGNATKAANAVQSVNKEVVSNERLDNICPPYFNEAAKDCVAKYIIPLATELSDEQLKSKLASISLPSEFWNSFDEQVQEIVPQTINIYAGTNENADLSNFAKRPFTVKGTTIGEGTYDNFNFPTVEHAFQAAKVFYADIENRSEWLTKIQNATTPQEARRLGKQIPKLNVKEWDIYSSEIMKELLTASFQQNPQALQRLLNTGNATLTHTQDKGKWGKEFPRLLMQVREELKKVNNVTSIVSQVQETVNAENKKVVVFDDGVKINTPFVLNEQQKTALKKLDSFVKSKDKVITLSGYAGTGKTSIMEIFAEKMQKDGVNVIFSATTNKAAAVLHNKVKPKGFEARTLHKTLGVSVEVDSNQKYDLNELITVVKDSDLFLINSVVVIDEASMINTEIYNIINELAENFNAKIIYVGDPAQLAPVKENDISKVFKDNTHDVVTLTQVERTGDNAILKEATNIRNGLDFSYKSEFNNDNNGVAYLKSTNIKNINETINYFIARQNSNVDYFKILAYTNAKVEQYNNYVRSVLGYDSLPKVGEPLMAYDNYGYNRLRKTYEIVNSDNFVIKKVGNLQPTNVYIDDKVYKLELLPLTIVDNFGNEINVKYCDVKNNKNNYDVAIRIANKIDSLWEKARYTTDRRSKAEIYSQINDYKRLLFINQDVVVDDSETNKSRLLIKKCIDFGYAITIHKSQGSTFQNVLIDDVDIQKTRDGEVLKQLRYVAISRASDTATIISNNNSVVEDSVINHKKLVDSRSTTSQSSLVQEETSYNPSILKRDGTYGTNPITLPENINVTEAVKLVREDLIKALKKYPDIIFKEDVTSGQPTSWQESGWRVSDVYYTDKIRENLFKIGYSEYNYPSLYGLVSTAVDKFINDKPAIYKEHPELEETVAKILLDKIPGSYVTKEKEYKEQKQKIEVLEKDLGSGEEAKTEIKDAVSVAVKGVSFEKALEGQESFFSKEEQNKIKQGLNGRNLQVMSVSRQTDPAFFSKEIISFLEKNAQKDLSDPTRVTAIELWSKHDGLPIKDILDACKKYRVAPMVSFSITGLGGTALEGGVMKYQDMLQKVGELIKNGTLNAITTTIRIDPILPGVTNMEDIKRIVATAKSLGIKKFVTSLVQSYGYTEGTKYDRKVISGINDALAAEGKTYNWDKYYGRDRNGKINFKPKQEVIDEIGKVLLELDNDPEITIQTCAFGIKGLKVSACLDPMIIERITGVDVLRPDGTYDRDTSRPECMCYGCHGDFFKGKNKKCYSSCAYCYAAHSGDNKLNYYNEDGTLKDNDYTRTSRQMEKKVTISTQRYRKGDPQTHPDVDMVFTENAEAYIYANKLTDDEIRNIKFPYQHAPKINVSDVGGTNQAGIRTDTQGNVSSNAYGIVVKNFQQDENGRFVAERGQFKDTEDDFKLFVFLNEHMFKRLENSSNNQITFPSQIALGKSALPLRFAEWLQKELSSRFGISSTVEKNTRKDYNGYGLKLTSVNSNVAQPQQEASPIPTVISPLQQTTDALVSEEQESIVLKDYLDNVQRVLFGNQQNNIQNVQSAYLQKNNPEILFFNKVRAEFLRDCKLNSYELNELSIDFVTRLSNFLTMFLQSDDLFGIYSELMPNIFNQKFKKEFDELKKQPSKKQPAQLVKLIGIDNLVSLIMNTFLNDSSIKEDLQTKLNIFNNPNYLSFLMMMSNPILNDVCGLHFQTKIHQKQNEQKETASQTEVIHKADKLGQLDLFEVEETNIEEENGTEDDSKKDIVREDSLTTSYLKNIDFSLRQKLQTLQKRGEKSIYNQNRNYTYTEVAHALLPVIYYAKNSEHMRRLIQNSDLSFKDDLLLMLLDPDFSTQLFHNFKKNKNRFVRMYRKESKVVITSVNESDAGLELDNIYSKALNYNIHKENSLLKVIDQQINKLEQTLYIVNEDGLTNLASLLNNIVNPNSNNKLKEHLNKNIQADETRLATYKNEFLQEEQTKNIVNVLNLLGFQNRVSAEALYNYLSTPVRIKDDNGQIIQIMPYRRYTDLVNILFNILDLLQQDKAFLKDTQKKFESNIEKLSKLVNNIAGNSVVYYTNVGDDSYFSYSNTNYIGRLLDTINNSNDEEFKKFVEEQFKSVNFFKPVFEEGFADDSSWIRDLYSNSNSAMLRNIFRLTIFTKYEAKKYQQLTDFEYDLFALKSYYNNNGNFAEYCLPVLSNKSRTGTIRWKKIKDANNLLDNLYLVFFQEASRMKDVVTRAKNRTPSDAFYKNYDIQIDDFNNIEVGKGGLRFMFMPMFNRHLKYVNNEKACEKNVICAYLHELLYQDHKYYNAARTEELRNACKEEIKNFLIGERDDFITILKQDGYYDFVKNELNFQNDDEFQRFINQFMSNNFFANTQIYQLLTTDLIFYSNADDVVKRTAEFISDGYALDSTASYYDENGEIQHVKKDKTYMVVPDFKQGFRNSEALNEMFNRRMQSDIDIVKNNSKLSDKEKEVTIKKIQDKVNRWKKLYNDIDTTDGQGFSSFNWHYNLMRATGRFTNSDAITYYNLKSLYDEFAELFYTDRIISKDDVRYQQLYEKVIEFNKYNDISYEPEKPFVYSQIIDNSVKVSVQIKNSEYPLLDLQSMMEEAVRTDKNGNYIGDNTLAKLAAFMHKNNVDVCVFDSNIKVGNRLSGNLVSDCTSISGLTKVQQTNMFSVPLEDVMKQQEIPNHVENILTALGVQLKNFIFAAMDPNSKIDFNGKKISVKELRELFESTFAKRIKYSSEKLIKDLKLDSVSPSERNVALSKFILSELSKKGTLDFDTQFRFSINDYGTFNIPLADVVSRKTIDEVFTSAVKRAALDIEFPGGQLVQVTDGFRFNSSNTTLERDSSLKIVYYDKNGKETDDMKKGVRVAYMEAEMPYFYKEMYEFDKDGYLIDDERAKKLVVYRIPTEGPCSVYPIKVTKWSNKINGGIIKLPAEIPGIGGMDFDIDKLFFVAPTLKFNKKTHQCEYVDDEYLKSHPKNTDDRNANIILEILWSVLTSNDNMPAMFIPSNFFDFSHNKNVQISFAMNNSDSLSAEEKLDLYEQLYSSDDKKLESESNAMDNRACCSYLFQRNAARVNSAGLQMLSVFANANSQHVYMQGEDLRCISENIIEKGIVNINGNTITHNDEFDPVFALDGFTKVYENITQGLTAAADAVKNPTLDQLNINRFTINLVVALFRRGFDIETICLIMQQPLMHLLTHIYNKEAMLNPDEKNISVGRIINIALNQRFPTYKYEQLKKCVLIDKPLNITKKDLVSNLGKPLSNLGERSQLARDQFDLLRALYSNFQYGFDLMNSNKLLKLDSTSSKHGNNSFEYMSRLFEISSNSQTNIFGFPDVLDPDTKWKRLKESFNQQLILFNRLWENLDPKFEQFFVNYNNSELIPKMESWELEDLYNDWMLYQFTNDVHGTNPFTFATDNEVSSVGYLPTADSIYNYMLKKFPAQALKKIEILQKTEQYQDNEFLKQLKSDIEDDTAILIVKTKDMGSVIKQKVQIGFHELFNDPQNQKFAMLLWMYNMYRNGFSTNKNAFWQLLPAEDVAKFQNYLQFLRTLNVFSTPEQTNNEFKSFEELYLRNDTDKFPELDPYMYPEIEKPIFTEKIEIGVPYVNKDYRNKHLFDKAANRQTFEQMRKEFEEEFDASQILSQSTTEDVDPNVLSDEQVREFFKDHFKDAQKINPKLSTDINEQKNFLRIFAKYC